MTDDTPTPGARPHGPSHDLPVVLATRTGIDDLADGLADDRPDERALLL